MSDIQQRIESIISYIENIQKELSQNPEIAYEIDYNKLDSEVKNFCELIENSQDPNDYANLAKIMRANIASINKMLVDYKDDIKEDILKLQKASDASDAYNKVNN